MCVCVCVVCFTNCFVFSGPKFVKQLFFVSLTSIVFPSPWNVLWQSQYSYASFITAPVKTKKNIYVIVKQCHCYVVLLVTRIVFSYNQWLWLHFTNSLQISWRWTKCPSHTLHILSWCIGSGEVLISVFGLRKSLHPSPNPFGSILAQGG